MCRYRTQNIVIMKHIVDIFSALGEQLTRFGSDENSNRIIEEAIAANGWFTRVDILRAVEAIRVEMLDRAKLESWLNNYTKSAQPKRVAVIMAGNIPLVGFFDLLCVLAAGHECHLKPSSKDSVLMRHVVDMLRDIEPQIAIYDYSADDKYDIAIATGGDDANRYFREHFATTRCLLRGSRHSVAVLDGTESAAEIEGLWRDITAYSGLGCRSISMLFIPRNGVVPEMHGEPINRKLKGTLSTTRALYAMKGTPYIDCGAFIMTEGREFPTTLAAVTLYRYDDISEVKEWIAKRAEKIQCIVSHADIANSVPFGKAQHPTLHDYADGVDTMAMLNEEKFCY